ncbi:hypothetical protein SAMN05216232_0225 [Virgibacillus subterraneus]|uniref:Lipoprotein n=1 Tax=Virgibacillus subterraneus TaxID=621109 RepID=A0A1H8Z068_9BACI|nr:hypothetical protein [Virgibacillus subterraneus]SEP57834.1 hypothetical protein SAMN05216232_0225 [Virgibacillus subterraneus]
MKKLLFLLPLLILVACGGESVEYEDNVNIDDQTLTIEGETTLEDGSVIHYEVTNFEISEILHEGTTKVTDGTFSVDLDASEYPAGEFEIYTAFLPYMQSEEIQEIYGESGENLKGDKVSKLEDMEDDIKVIESRRTFEKQ